MTEFTHIERCPSCGEERFLCQVDDDRAWCECVCTSCRFEGEGLSLIRDPFKLDVSRRMAGLPGRYQYVAIDIKHNGDEGHPRWISVGLVAEDGREFYAELSDTWEPSDCTEAVTAEVLPNLEGWDCLMTLAELRPALDTWLRAIGDAVVLLGGSLLERGFINDVFGGRDHCPASLIALRWGHSRVVPRLEQLRHQQGLRQHHALDEARARGEIWRMALAETGNDFVSGF